ncbi:MAG: (Fe-S)-binding protein, partial [Acidobacteriota bacterium]|nr:(Fe-S)-binding protein [Acidobacteriota bacterium]
MIPSAATLSSTVFQTRLGTCIRCGLCLPACPTYELSRTEMEGPRGRIALIRAAADGRAELDGAVREHLDLCLGCRACETACPSGVEYGFLLEGAREAIESRRKPRVVERFTRWLALRQLLPSPKRLRLVAWLLRAKQLVGVPQLVAAIGPASIQRLAALLPPLRLRRTGYGQPAPAHGERRGIVAFFHGCVQDAFLHQVNAATIRVLQRNGYEVHVPRSQTCCGAAALHLGEAKLARELAVRNVDAFTGRYDFVINNAGGCGAALKQYGDLLRDTPVPETARSFSAKVRDISEFLGENLHSPPTGRIDGRATYADSCHLRHGQGVVEAPRELLWKIPGLDLVELSAPDTCCGSAGVYNITQRETADRLLDVKMTDVASTHAEYVV